MKGYKAFNSDLTCLGMQYEVGKEYTHDGDISLCKQGFHFCEQLTGCYQYYDSKSRICEVEALGEVKSDGIKSVTDHIRIVRELAQEEIVALANVSVDNAGVCNSGNRNSGDWNTGNYNSGDWNTTNFSSGVLCTEESECLIFDKPSGITLREWRNTKAAYLMSRIRFDTTKWVREERMTDEEKADNPQYEILGGYLKEYQEPHYAFSEWWDALIEDERDAIKAIPNFDADKWYRITGIDLRGEHNE